MSMQEALRSTQMQNLYCYIKDSMMFGLDLANCIQLLEECQLEEWIAVHVIEFFDKIILRSNLRVLHRQFVSADVSEALQGQMA